MMMIPIQRLNAVDAFQPSEEGCNLTMVKGVELGPAGTPVSVVSKPAKNVFWEKTEGQAVSIWLNKLFVESKRER